MTKHALIVWGGWDGHTPKACAELFAPTLEAEGYAVELVNTLEVYEDAEAMARADLIVPMWTMGEITKRQCQGLTDAVAAGSGLAGFHGGMCDAFRENTNYQWMTGGQWVAHPGGRIPSYTIDIVNDDHPITSGMSDFKMLDTEQYYLHVDPSNEVLATTTFDSGCVMPAVWTRSWGRGRVAYASFGHTDQDFHQTPEAFEIVKRAMLWATR